MLPFAWATGTGHHLLGAKVIRMKSIERRPLMTNWFQKDMRYAITIEFGEALKATSPECLCIELVWYDPARNIDGSLLDEVN